MTNKQLISTRIETQLYTDIEKLKQPKESKSALVERVLKAGVQSLQASKEQTNSEHVSDLRRTIDMLEKQLETKDAQISTLESLANHAQTLAGMNAANTNKALKPPMLERLKAAFKGDT